MYACFCINVCNQSCPTLCDTMDCGPPGSSVHGDSPGNNTEDLPKPVTETRSPTLQADSLPSEPQGRPYKCIILFN